MDFKIYTTVNGARFYFDRNDDTFKDRPVIYEYENEYNLLCTLIEATAKTSEMHEALTAIDLGQYKLNLFIE